MPPAAGAEEEEFLRRESSVPPLTDPSLQSVSPRTGDVGDRSMETSGWLGDQEV